MNVLWICLGALVFLLIGAGIASSGGGDRRRRGGGTVNTVAFTGANYSGLAGIHLPNRLLQSSGGMFLEDEDGNRVTMFPTVTLQDKEFYESYNKLVDSKQPGSLGSTVCHRGSVGTTKVVVNEKENGARRQRHEDWLAEMEEMVAEKMATPKPSPSSPGKGKKFPKGDKNPAAAKTKAVRAETESPDPAPRVIPADQPPSD